MLHVLSVRLYPSVSSMQNACAILSSVACPAVQYFSTLSRKRHDIRKKKVIEYETCVLIFSTNFVILVVQCVAVHHKDHHVHLLHVLLPQH